MKHFFLFIAAFFIIINACNKKDKPVTKTSLLTSGPWVVTAVVSDEDGNGTYELNDYLSFESCYKDNFYTFKESGQLEINEGATKCSSTDPQTDAVTWQLSNNDTTLKIDADTYSVLMLNNTTLQLKQDFGAGTSSMVTFTKK
jgi:hypothetical protein